MKNDHTAYVADLTAQLKQYGRSAFPVSRRAFDPDYSERQMNPPVFLHECAELNVLVPDDPALAAAVRGLLPRPKQHRWFRSMKSSQALALSVFGNLKVLNRTGCLSDVMADDGDGPAFGGQSIEPGQLTLEHDVDTLNEPTPTSVDLLVSGTKVVCVECKLSEPEVGRCSRPQLKKDHSEYCDGSYRHAPGRLHPCVLARRGTTYWRHVPAILGGREWQTDIDHNICPLAAPYQLVRNILSACVAGGEVNLARGHALLVYDNRNPAFRTQSEGTFDSLRARLAVTSVLRRCSWQSIIRVMADHEDLAWLVRELHRKYGLEPTGKQS